MSEQLTRRLTAGLGGMALALLLVGMVVQQARAGSECYSCEALAQQQAKDGVCKQYEGGPHYIWQGCIYGEMQKKCWQGDNPPCPGESSGGTNCSSFYCRSAGIEFGVCGNDMQAGDICSNECINQSCGSWPYSGNCATVPADELSSGGYPVSPTNCAVKCGCD